MGTQNFTAETLFKELREPSDMIDVCAWVKNR